MPAPKKSYTQEEYDNAFNDALSLCENYEPSEVAHQMAKDMLKIVALQKKVDELSQKA